jgi:hypothetical protein
MINGFNSSSAKIDSKTKEGKRTAVGQYSRDPQRRARFLFFKQFKEFVPEAIQDLKKSCIDCRKELCYLLINRLLQMNEDDLDVKLSAEFRNELKKILDGWGIQVCKDSIQSLEEKYRGILRRWAEEWNLSEDRWERGKLDVIILAAAEVDDSLIDPLIRCALNDAHDFYYGSRAGFSGLEVAYFRDSHSIDCVMERVLGPAGGETTGGDANISGKTPRRLWMPSAKEAPSLFRSLFEQLTVMLGDQRIEILPARHELVYSDPGWDPRFESRSKAVERIRRSFEHRLQEHLSSRQLEIEQLGFLPIPISLSRKPRNAQRFEWLIRYQTQKWSKTRIAKEYHVDRNAVQESLKNESGLIGLTLRE